MMQGQEIEVGRLLLGGGYYVLTIAGVITISFYAVRSFRSDIDRVITQTDKNGSKLDAVQSTLGVMQAAAARHDQRASDIQERVLSIDSRVTYLERRE